jgi:hypothetical protein
MPPHHDWPSLISSYYVINQPNPFASNRFPKIWIVQDIEEISNVEYPIKLSINLSKDMNNLDKPDALLVLTKILNEHKMNTEHSTYGFNGLRGLGDKIPQSA